MCFFFLFFPAVGLAVAVPRRRSAQTPRGDPPRHKSTTGHRDPRLGLAGRGSGFFFIFSLFFLGFRMIKSQKGSFFLLGFSFEALETSFVALESIFEALETIL